MSSEDQLPETSRQAPGSEPQLPTRTLPDIPGVETHGLPDQNWTVDHALWVQASVLWASDWKLVRKSGCRRCSSTVSTCTTELRPQSRQHMELPGVETKTKAQRNLRGPDALHALHLCRSQTQTQGAPSVKR